MTFYGPDRNADDLRLRDNLLTFWYPSTGTGPQKALEAHRSTFIMDVG